MDIQSFSPLPGQNNIQLGKTGAYAELLEDVDKDEGVLKAKAQADSLQKEYDSFQSGMALPQKDRRGKFSDIYNDCWNEALQKHKPVGKAIIYGTFFAGPIVGVATQCMGMDPRIGGIVCLTSLVLAFSSKIGTGRMYVEAIKRWVLPGQADKLMTNQLEQKRVVLESRLTEAKTALEQTRSGVMKKIAGEIQQHQDATINDEQEFISIDGVKLNKK